jgi:hypothetical protein
MQLTKLNVSEAATSLGVSKSWLDKKRLDGGGPEYHKFGRRVLYDVDEPRAVDCNCPRPNSSLVCSQLQIGKAPVCDVGGQSPDVFPNNGKGGAYRRRKIKKRAQDRR